MRLFSSLWLSASYQLIPLIKTLNQLIYQDIRYQCKFLSRMSSSLSRKYWPSKNRFYANFGHFSKSKLNLKKGWLHSYIVEVIVKKLNINKRNRGNKNYSCRIFMFWNTCSNTTNFNSIFHSHYWWKTGKSFYFCSKICL